VYEIIAFIVNWLKVRQLVIADEQEMQNLLLIGTDCTILQGTFILAGLLHIKQLDIVRTKGK